MKNKELLNSLFILILSVLPFLVLGKIPEILPNQLNSGVIITGEIINGNSTSDTATLYLDKEFGTGNGTLPLDSSVVVISRDHHFSIAYNNLTRPRYFTLGIVSGIHSFPFDQYLMEPGDSIHLVYDQTARTIKYTGINSAKFNWLYNLSLNTNKFQESLSKPVFMGEPAEFFANIERTLDFQLGELEKVKNVLSVTAYNILKADLIARNRLTIFETMRISTFGHEYDNPDMAEEMDQLYGTKYLNLPTDLIDTSYLVLSGYYSCYLLTKDRADFLFRQYHQQLTDSTIFAFLQNRHVGIVRDKIIVDFVFGSLGFEFNENMMNNALNSVKDPYYYSILLDVKRKLGKGAELTDFNFQDKDGNAVDFKRFMGKVVFIDMWFTGCTGCVEVAKNMPAVEKAFEGNPNVVFVSLSIDRDKQRWLKSINPKQMANDSYTHYTSSTTIYLYTNGTGSNNTFIKKFNLLNSYPELLLVGKNGKIFSMTPTRPDEVDGQSRLIQEISQALKN